MNISIELCIFELVYVPNYSLNWQFWFFGPNLPKRLFLVENGKSEHLHWILHIRISLDTILVFWTIFTKKGYLRCKTENLRFCVRPWSLLTKLIFSVEGMTDTTVFMSFLLLVAETKRLQHRCFPVNIAKF